MKFLKWRRKNNREHDRKLCGNTTAFLTIQDQEYACTVENLSRGGALLVIDGQLPLKIGELIEIQIPFSDSKQYVKKTAQVKRFKNKNIAIKFMW